MVMGWVHTLGLGWVGWVGPICGHQTVPIYDSQCHGTGRVDIFYLQILSSYYLTVQMTVYLNPVNQKVWDVMQDSAYLTPIDVANLKQRRTSIAG